MIVWRPAVISATTPPASCGCCGAEVTMLTASTIFIHEFISSSGACSFKKLYKNDDFFSVFERN